jgi:AmmeMemoRadiSam system protein A
MFSTNRPSTDAVANTEPGTGLCEEEHILLRQIALEAVEFGLKHGKHLAIDTSRYPKPLQKPGACFVTLKLAGQLRGCIGSLEAHQSLVNDVAYNAFAAAFSDPRFPPVSNNELENLEFHISVLTPAVAMDFDSEEDLLKQIQPGIDGLVLEENQHRGTFLPAVWESLPEAESFLRHLKQKAGLPQDYWSESIKVSRYTTESF